MARHPIGQRLRLPVDGALGREPADQLAHRGDAADEPLRIHHDGLLHQNTVGGVCAIGHRAYWRLAHRFTTKPHASASTRPIVSSSIAAASMPTMIATSATTDGQKHVQLIGCNSASAARRTAGWD